MDLSSITSLVDCYEQYNARAVPIRLELVKSFVKLAEAVDTKDKYKTDVAIVNLKNELKINRVNK